MPSSDDADALGGWEPLSEVDEEEKDGRLRVGYGSVIVLSCINEVVWVGGGR